MFKKNIREAYQEKRHRLSPEVFATDSQALVAQFATYPIPPLNYLLSYKALENRNEFNPEPCSALLLARYPNLITAWPKITGSNGSMEACIANGVDEFVPNRYLIPEPVGGVSIAPQLLDIVFVPLLAVDVHGYRVGYGKGYYDRFLALCRPGVLRVGFSFFEPVEAISDVDQFDVPLNICITPKRIYEF